VQNTGRRFSGAQEDHVDDSFYRGFNSLARNTSWAHGLITAYAKYGIVVFSVLFLAAWWWARLAPDPEREMALLGWACIGAVVAFVVAQGIGALVDRSRPYETIHDAVVLIPRSSDVSFPSDHATVAGALAAGLWLVNRRVGQLAVVAAVALGLARVYVGVHFVSDVVGGLVLGAAVALIGSRPAVRVLRPLVVALERIPLVRPLIRAGP
jgi:undecaprenyl-diphosphatase